MHDPARLPDPDPDPDAEPPERIEVRRARPEDLDALLAIERESFPPERRASRRSLRLALSSPSQSVWIACRVRSAAPPAPACGAMVLRHHRLSLRVYSIAVSADARRSGVGSRLMAEAIAIARRSRVARVSLEADKANAALLAWYAKRGFKPERTLDDYYSPGAAAVRMALALRPHPHTHPHPAEARRPHWNTP